MGMMSRAAPRSLVVDKFSRVDLHPPSCGDAILSWFSSQAPANVSHLLWCGYRYACVLELPLRDVGAYLHLPPISKTASTWSPVNQFDWRRP
jgi:hypothetical protein